MLCNSALFPWRDTLSVPTHKKTKTLFLFTTRSCKKKKISDFFSVCKQALCGPQAMSTVWVETHQLYTYGPIFCIPKKKSHTSQHASCLENRSYIVRQHQPATCIFLKSFWTQLSNKTKFGAIRWWNLSCHITQWRSKWISRPGLIRDWTASKELIYLLRWPTTVVTNRTKELQPWSNSCKKSEGSIFLFLKKRKKKKRNRTTPQRKHRCNQNR